MIAEKPPPPMGFFGVRMRDSKGIKTVELVGLTWMHKTGCSGETRLVLHVPSSS